MMVYAAMRVGPVTNFLSILFSSLPYFQTISNPSLFPSYRCQTSAQTVFDFRRFSITILHNVNVIAQ